VGTLQEGSTDQARIWNGPGGTGWVAAQGLLDRTFEPLQELLVDAVRTASAKRVLDVGCGTGATTVAVARQLGGNGSCLGIDLSETMVDAARARAEREGVPARFVWSDAETFAFDRASVDMVISRFGVMFFANPTRAFANLRGVASDRAELCCIVWRSPAENPFMTEAERAAEPLLPGVSRRVPHEPGQFGLADRSRTRDILTESGWRDIEISPIDVSCTLPATELDLYLSQLGPVGRAPQTASQGTRERVLEATRPAFDRYMIGDEIRFTAACWRIEARATAREAT